MSIVYLLTGNEWNSKCIVPRSTYCPDVEPRSIVVSEGQYTYYSTNIQSVSVLLYRKRQQTVNGGENKLSLYLKEET